LASANRSHSPSSSYRTKATLGGNSDLFIIAACLSLLLSIIFLLSSIPKLRRPKGFVLAVLEYRILPSLPSKIYGWSLPPLEMLLALLLLSGTSVRLTALVLSLLLLSFILAVSINVARGRDLDCGCFGAKKQRKIGWTLLLEDLALLGGALTLAILPSSWIDVEPWSIFRFIPARLASPLAFLLCVGIAAGAALLLRRKSALKGKKRLAAWH
jgi:uncharacterized membrane protein YphA (DoxX/SURF4 family)